jgi:hypothetical protein
MLYAAKENVAESIESGFGEMVVGPLLEEARTNMKGDYEKVMGQEPNTKRNPWVQEDPSESDAFKYIRAEIDGEERKISWHGGNSSPIDPSRRRNRIFNSNMYQTRAMRSVKYRFQAIDTDELDAVKDRPLGDSISLKVAIPFYQRGSSETNKANVFMRSFLAVGKPHDNQAGYDEYVKILEYNINSRTSKKVDKFTGGTWKLWRAIEYGQVSSRYKRVFAKNVISYKEVPTEVKEDDMRSDAKVAYASSIVTDDAWTIFMSPHWKWWSRQAVPVNGKLLIKVDNGSSYQVGLAPIRKAIMRGTNDEYMNMLITSLIDSAMTDAGFIRG